MFENVNKGFDFVLETGGDILSSSVDIINEQVKNYFGYEITKTDNKKLKTFEKEKEYGAIETTNSDSGFTSYHTDFYNIPTTTIDQIKMCRTLSNTADLDRVLTEIRNEIFIFNDDDKKAVEICFDNKNKILSDKMMKLIRAEYDAIYNIFDFNKKGIEYFLNWYIDGRLFLYKVIDSNKPSNGIQKIIWIDPLKIKKVIEYPKEDENGLFNLSNVNEYYLYSDIEDLWNANVNNKKIKYIKKDVISYIDSGIYDKNTNEILSFLWKSIIPYNNLRMMEEALLIYRVVRSPERRVFYVNVGNLPKTKAEQYIKNLMQDFRSKLSYDARTGSIASKANVLSMVEDYWFPRRDDGKGTEVTTLPGAANLGAIDDVNFFKQKFYESTNVPMSRFKDDLPSSFVFGRSIEISRDEYRFKKYLDRLKQKYPTDIFYDLLKTQLLLKNIIKEHEWEKYKSVISFDFAEDNNLTIWKEQEVLKTKIDTLSSIDPYVWKYVTLDWILKNVMNFSDDDISTMKDEIEKYNLEQQQKELEANNQMKVNNQMSANQNVEQGVGQNQEVSTENTT